MNYFKKQAYKRDNPTLKQVYKGREIESARLAGQCDGLYYAIIDGMLDTEIKPSKYQGIVIRRIKPDYYYSRYPNHL